MISLDGDGSTTYLITCAAMLPLWRRLGMNPLHLACLLMLVSGVMNLSPWGGPTGRAAAALQLDVSAVFLPLLPAMAAGLAAVFALATVLGLSERRRMGVLDLPTPYRQVKPDFAPFTDDLEPGRRTGGERARLAKALRAYLNRRDLDVDDSALNAAPLDELVAGLAMSLPFSPAEKQALLEAPDRGDRQDVLTALLEIDALGDDDGPPETLQ